MSEVKEGTIKITTPVLQSFPNLDEAKAVKQKNGKPSGEPKFSNNFEFPADHPDLPLLKAEAVKIAKAKWPGRAISELAFPFSSGDKLADKAVANGKEREWSRGHAVLTARSKYQPRLAVLDGGRLVDVDGDDKARVKKLFYNGCTVLGEVSFNAYDGVGTNPDGVNAYLNVVISLNKGARLSGGSSAAEAFKGYIGSDSAEDPTGGLDEEIPF